MREVFREVAQREPTMEVPLELALRAQEGDEEARSAVCTIVLPIIERTVGHFEQNPDLAEDVAAKAIIRVFEKGMRRKDLFNDGNFAAWATTVTRNVARTATAQQRAEQNKSINSADWEAIAETMPRHRIPATEDVAIENEAISRIRAMLGAAKVYEGAKDAFILLHVYEMPIKAIAKELGMPEGTVFSRTHRALRAIRTHFGITEGDRRWDIFCEKDDSYTEAA